MKKTLHMQGSGILLLIAVFFIPIFLFAQFPYTETFKNSTARRMVFSGSAQLTSGTIDPAGEGFLRLTGNANNETGSAYNATVFNSNQGLTVEFEYFVHGGIPFPNPGGTTGDGFSFFLFDGDAAYSPGAYGGSLGYANKNLPPTEVIDGLGHAYIGIGLDEFGNFSSTYEGKNGGPGFTPSAVAIRGPGNGQGVDAYVYQTGQQTTAAPFNFPLTNNAIGRDPLPSGSGYRKVKIEMNPIITAGVVTGYTVTVKITTGGATPVEHTVINAYVYDFVPPPHLKFGFAASTGLATSYHEIRNLGVNVFDPAALGVPAAVDDAGNGCQGGDVAVNVVANDYTPNGGGTPPYPAGVNINKATVDLDVVTAGVQSSFTQAGVGTWSADTSGVVTFVPVPAFNGVAAIQYYVTDVYGETTTTPGTITINISTDIAPVLTVVSPQIACSPATVDITASPAVWTAVPGGGTVSYTSDAPGNNILPAPAAINTPGRYYIRYTGTNGCSVFSPVDVSIGDAAAVPAVVANYHCGPGTVTLTASGGRAGETYRWYDASGSGNLLQDGGSSFTTPALNATTQYWVSLYVSSGAGCESARVPVTASINDLPSGVDAGPGQSLTGVAGIQLAGSSLPAGQEGLWTLVSGPNVPTIVEPTQPNGTVSGIIPGTYVFAWTVQHMTCTATDQVTVGVLSILPVTFVSFTGTLKGEMVWLNWSTATESNNDHFVVERSSDGGRFEAIGQVLGNGNSSTLLSYTYSDPVAGVRGERLYYRLRQVDLDGRSAYSKVITVQLPTGRSVLTVAPNPFIDQVNLHAVVPVSGQATIAVYHANGALLKQYSTRLERGGNNVVVRLDGLAPGMYTLRVILSDRSKQSWNLLKR